MPQNVLDTDSFSGVNADALATYNSNWAPLDLTNLPQLAIRGTPGVGGTTAGGIQGGNLRNGFTWTTDHWAELTIDATTLADLRFLVCVRCTQGSGNNCTGYAGGAHRDLTGGTYQIYEFTAPSSFTALATAASASYAVNDVVNLEAVGNELNLRVNGVLVVTTTDSTYSNGSPGLLLGSQLSRLGGSWRAGSVGNALTIVGRSVLDYGAD